MSVSLVLVLILVLAAEFVNGWNDAPNAIATVVSTRVLRPYHALAIASFLNVMGAVVAGTAVAATIGKGFVKPEAVGLAVVGASVLGIAIWSALATWRGLPISTPTVWSQGWPVLDWLHQALTCCCGPAGRRCS